MTYLILIYLASVAGAWWLFREALLKHDDNRILPIGFIAFLCFVPVGNLVVSVLIYLLEADHKFPDLPRRFFRLPKKK